MKKILILLISSLIIVTATSQIKANTVCDKGNVCVEYNNSTQQLKLYGQNYYGRFGIDSSTTTVYKENAILVNDLIPDNEMIKDYNITLNNTFIITKSGKYYGAGQNNIGQLGVMSTSPTNKFTFNPLSKRYKGYTAFYLGHGLISNNKTSSVSYNYSNSSENNPYTGLDIGSQPFTYTIQNGHDELDYTRTYWLKTNNLKRIYSLQHFYPSKKKGYKLTFKKYTNTYDINGLITHRQEENIYRNTYGSKKESNWSYHYSFLVKKYSKGKAYSKSYITKNTKKKIKKKYTYSKSKSGITKDYRINYSYKSNQKTITKLRIYVRNKKGQLKSNKNGNAYRYITKYKNGKAKSTTRQQYNSNGKLSKKLVRVKLRK